MSPISAFFTGGCVGAISVILAIAAWVIWANIMAERERVNNGEDSYVDPNFPSGGSINEEV